MIIIIYNYFFLKKLIPRLNKKTDSLKTINFNNMGHRFEISEKWGEAGGTLKFGFAQGRVKTFVLSMPIDRLIPSPWVDLQFGQDHSFLFLAIFSS